MSNIFLIGMMGVGKTTIGKLLSKKLSFPFFDMDNEIEKIMDMSIAEIFEQYGEKRFRLIEATFFNECTKNHNLIFATGGGIILKDKNQQILETRGTSFLLDCNIKKIISRIQKNTSLRPLVQNTQTITKIYNERKLLYEKCAHHIIETTHLNPQEIVLKIEKYLNA